MKVFYTDFSKSLGFNYRNKKSLFVSRAIFVIIELNPKNIIRIRIPEGFESDGCTLKLKILWLLFGCPHNGKYIPASIIHDYILDNPELVCYNMNISSQIFKQALLNEKVNIFTSNLMYLAVLIYQTLKKIFIKLKENIKCLIQNNF